MMIRKDTLLYKVTQLHWFLLLTIIAMAMFGSLILFSAGSSAHDLETGLLKIDARYAMDHIFRFTIMLGVALFVALLPLRLWAALAYPGYALGIVLLFGVEVAGNIVNGSQRWLTIGPLTLQPSELMKIAVPLAVAPSSTWPVHSASGVPVRQWVSSEAEAVLPIPISPKPTTLQPSDAKPSTMPAPCSIAWAHWATLIAGCSM